MRLSYNVVKIALFSVVILTMIFYHFYTLKISSDQITADNFESILTKSNSSILNENNFNQYIPDKFPVFTAYEFADSKNYNGNGLEITNKKGLNGNFVEITSLNSRLVYYLGFTHNILDYAYVFRYGLMDESQPKTYFIKKIINELLLNDGFSLKKTKLKSGQDIIIKETNDTFIIGKFFSGDGEDIPQYIVMNSFRKTRYFNFLRFN
jgi:hypothetical protein